MSTSGASNGLTGGVAGILSDPRQAANGGKEATGYDSPPDDKGRAGPDEEALCKKLWAKFDDARKFDENFRKQVAIDRRYAAGTSDLSWAVTTNLIGAFIDILVALLYARDPDVVKCPRLKSKFAEMVQPTHKSERAPQPTTGATPRTQKSGLPTSNVPPAPLRVCVNGYLTTAITLGLSDTMIKQIPGWNVVGTLRFELRFF